VLTGFPGRDTRAVVVINPLSGRGRHENQVHADAALAHLVLAAHGIEATVRPTTAAGDAHRFAREALADGIGLIVAWGGDGTINEVASAVMQTPAVLAVVPAGSGNGLAGDLGIPFDARAAFEVAATGKTITIDAGQVDGHAFFNIAGIGIDAVIAARFAERGLRRRGRLGYLSLSMNELLRYRAKTYTLTVDGDVLTRPVMLLALANGRQYGNRVLIAPGARLDDGLLEVVIVQPMSLALVASKLPSLFRGTLRESTGITMRAAREVDVETAGEIPFHVDGEPRLGVDRVRVRAIPGALKVRAPK
jgi:YegS/Rv2252/BmrU family lipid kinase